MPRHATEFSVPLFGLIPSSGRLPGSVGFWCKTKPCDLTAALKWNVVSVQNLNARLFIYFAAELNLKSSNRRTCFVFFFARETCSGNTPANIFTPVDKLPWYAFIIRASYIDVTFKSSASTVITLMKLKQIVSLLFFNKKYNSIFKYKFWQ